MDIEPKHDNLILKADPVLTLELLHPRHAEELFSMIDTHRSFLNEWLSFIPRMQRIENTIQFIAGSMERNRAGMEYAFMLRRNEQAIGRIGIYKIDAQHRNGEIGYWLIPEAQGNGAMNLALKKLIEFCFETLDLHRLEIRCAEENVRSARVAERSGFQYEGLLRDAEYLHDRFVTLKVYSLLK